MDLNQVIVPGKVLGSCRLFMYSFKPAGINSSGMIILEVFRL
jgi:hypothetical protein